MRLSLSFLIVLLFIGDLWSQSVFAPLNKDYYNMLDRYEIRSGSLPDAVHSSVRPYERKAIIEFMDSLNIDSSKFSRADRFNITYLQNDNWEWSIVNNDSRKPIFKKLYQKKSDFYQVSTDGFDLHVNPVLYFQAGHESAFPDIRPTINSRGLEVRGMINKKIGFYTFATDNQVVFPG
jgi:hypothetical protein